MGVACPSRDPASGPSGNRFADGVPSDCMLERALYWFGYAFAHLLFLGAQTPEAVVSRLRLAYRLVGVDIRETETVDGVERTVFLCPYRNLLAGRYGEKWVCHEKLDRVDDGYVTYLARHRDLQYDRPQSCPDAACCFSEVSRQ